MWLWLAEAPDPSPMHVNTEPTPLLKVEPLAGNASLRFRRSREALRFLALWTSPGTALSKQFPRRLLLGATEVLFFDVPQFETLRS